MFCGNYRIGGSLLAAMASCKKGSTTVEDTSTFLVITANNQFYDYILGHSPVSSLVSP
jgi:hypothetical protein